MFGQAKHRGIEEAMEKNGRIAGSMERQSKMKLHIPRKAFIAAIFLAGLLIFAFPIVSAFVYAKAASSANASFDATTTQIEETDIQASLNLAYAYNERLAEQEGAASGYSDSTSGNSASSDDAYSEEDQEAGVEACIQMLTVNEQVGYITIPKLSLNVPIYAGTSEDVLQKGVGYMAGTSLPVGGTSTHTVLTGHSGLPTATLFTNLNQLEIGDRFYIRNIGETLAYEVDQILVVDPTDFSNLTIVSGEDYCTLLTCTPYMINSHRLLVRGHRVYYVAADEAQEVKEGNANNIRQGLATAGLAILAVLAVLVFLVFKKKRKLAKAQVNGGDTLQRIKKE